MQILIGNALAHLCWIASSRKAKRLEHIRMRNQHWQYESFVCILQSYNMIVVFLHNFSEQQLRKGPSSELNLQGMCIYIYKYIWILKSRSLLWTLNSAGTSNYGSRCCAWKYTVLSTVTICWYYWLMLLIWSTWNPFFVIISFDSLGETSKSKGHHRPLMLLVSDQVWRLSCQLDLGMGPVGPVSAKLERIWDPMLQCFSYVANLSGSLHTICPAHQADVSQVWCWEVYRCLEMWNRRMMMMMIIVYVTAVSKLAGGRPPVAQRSNKVKDVTEMHTPCLGCEVVFLFGWLSRDCRRTWCPTTTR